MTRFEGKATRIDLKDPLSEDADLLRTLMRMALQEVLEAEIADVVGAAKGERTPIEQPEVWTFGVEAIRHPGCAS